MLKEIGRAPINKLNLVLFLMSLSLFTSATIAIAQEAKDPVKTSYLLHNSGSNGVVLSTFYVEVAPTTAFATLNNTVGKVFMIDFGVHLNRKFAVSYYSARSPKTNVVNVPAPTDPEYQDWVDSGVRLDQLPAGATQAFLSFVHNGLNLSYMHQAEKVIFWRTGVRFGLGKLQLTAEKKQLFKFFNTTIFEKRVITFNPEIGVGVNLRSWWRLHLDLGYHFVFGGSQDIIDPSLFDGTTFKFGFAFGNFAN